MAGPGERSALRLTGINSPKGKRDREAARFDVQGITGSLIERDALMLEAFARCKPKGLPDPIRHSRNTNPVSNGGVFL